MSWILKGTLLGIWLFSYGTIAFLWYRSPAASTTDIRALSALTISNPSWWLGLVACTAIGLIIARSWPGKPILWIGLAVTELVPVGLLALILVMVAKLKAIK